MTKSDVQDRTCEQSDTRVDNYNVGDKVTDMTKYYVQYSCEQSDTCVDNSAVHDNVTDLTKFDVQDSCEQGNS